MDVSYAIALHMLIIVSESDVPMSSADIAQSAGVNAAQIRRIAGLLKKRGILTSRRGVPGFELTKSAKEITLLEVYSAVYGSDAVQLFPVHKNPNEKCPVGRYIQPVLGSVFGEAEASAARAMNGTTLDCVISSMRKAAEADEAANELG